MKVKNKILLSLLAIGTVSAMAFTKPTSVRAEEKHVSNDSELQSDDLVFATELSIKKAGQSSFEPTLNDEEEEITQIDAGDVLRVDYYIIKNKKGFEVGQFQIEYANGLSINEIEMNFSSFYSGNTPLYTANAQTGMVTYEYSPVASGLVYDDEGTGNAALPFMSVTFNAFTLNNITAGQEFTFGITPYVSPLNANNPLFTPNAFYYTDSSVFPAELKPLSYAVTHVYDKTGGDTYESYSTIKSVEKANMDLDNAYVYYSGSAAITPNSLLTVKDGNNNTIDLDKNNNVTVSWEFYKILDALNSMEEYSDLRSEENEHVYVARVDNSGDSTIAALADSDLETAEHHQFARFFAVGTGHRYIEDLDYYYLTKDNGSGLSESPYSVHKMDKSKIIVGNDGCIVRWTLSGNPLEDTSPSLFVAAKDLFTYEIANGNFIVTNLSAAAQANNDLLKSIIWPDTPDWEPMPIARNYVVEPGIYFYKAFVTSTDPNLFSNESAIQVYSILRPEIKTGYVVNNDGYEYQGSLKMNYLLPEVVQYDFGRSDNSFANLKDLAEEHGHALYPTFDSQITLASGTKLDVLSNSTDTIGYRITYKIYEFNASTSTYTEIYDSSTGTGTFSNKGVGTYYVVASVDDDLNYLIGDHFVSWHSPECGQSGCYSFTVNKAQVSVSIINSEDLTREYEPDTSMISEPLFTTTFPAGNTTDHTFVTITSNLSTSDICEFTLSRASGNNVGEYAVSLSYIDTNYEITLTGNPKFVITPATPTFTYKTSYVYTSLQENHYPIKGYDGDAVGYSAAFDEADAPASPDPDGTIYFLVTNTDLDGKEGTEVAPYIHLSYYAYDSTEEEFSTTALTSAPVNAGTYKVVVTVDATDNYNSITSSAGYFTISKAQVAAPSIEILKGNYSIAEYYDHPVYDGLSKDVFTFHYNEDDVYDSVNNLDGVYTISYSAEKLNSSTALTDGVLITQTEDFVGEDFDSESKAKGLHAGDYTIIFRLVFSTWEGQI